MRPQLVDAVRQRLLAIGGAGQVEPALVLMILREFSIAKLDPGPELRKLMEHLMEGMAASGPNAPETNLALDTHIEDLVREVGGDPFELYAQMYEMADAFPEDHRAAMGAWLLQSPNWSRGKLLLASLLDPSASVRNSTASDIEQAAAMGSVSGVMLRRLIAIRNWLPEADRVSLDRAIQTCRRKGVDIGAWPQPQVREVLASGIDGAGAQSVFILVREGRRNAVACLLLKHGIGVRDAWARHSLTRVRVGRVSGPGSRD